MKSRSLIIDVKPLVSMRELEHLLRRDRRSLEKLSEKAGRYYRPFDLRPIGSIKKWRHIDNPIGELKEIQSSILREILSRAAFPNNMLGGRPGKTILDNAKLHLASPYLFTLDLRSCFPRTHDLSVYKAFREKLGCSPQIASLLTKLTTFQHRLPQGAPTSLMLANLTLVDLYRDIEAITSPLGLELSFWVDDIAISGGESIRQILDQVFKLVSSYGHSAPRSKVRFMPNHTPQRLTGVTVNSRPSSGRIRIQEIERIILNMAERDVIFEDDLKSLEGKSRFAAYINETQGRALRKMSAKRLPAKGIQRLKMLRDEKCKCKRTRRHKHPNGLKPVSHSPIVDNNDS